MTGSRIASLAGPCRAISAKSSESSDSSTSKGAAWPVTHRQSFALLLAFTTSMKRSAKR